MNQKYNQPFCVLGKKRRFKGVRFGYLPPLEYPNDDDIEARVEKLEKLELRKTTLGKRD